MTTVRAAVAAATAALARAGVPDAARDARRLMAHALGIGPDRLLLHDAEPIAPSAAAEFEAMVGERRRFRPVAQIIGRRAFWGRDFRVSAAVLDPRPETEILIAAALAGPAPTSILDLGTGSGILILTLLAEWPDAVGVGTDIDPGALAVARENARTLGIGPARCRLTESDWCADVEGRFDLVVSNPPYVSADEYAGLDPGVRDWEPRHALTPGPTRARGLCGDRGRAPRPARTGRRTRAFRDRTDAGRGGLRPLRRPRLRHRGRPPRPRRARPGRRSKRIGPPAIPLAMRAQMLICCSRSCKQRPIGYDMTRAGSDTCTDTSGFRDAAALR